MSILNPGSNQKEKIGVILLIIVIIYAITSSGRTTYQCYESKTNDGFQVKTGWELVKMRFEGNCDYEEIIKIDK